MILTAGGRFFLLGASAHIMNEDQVQAWAEGHVRVDDDIKWIVGNYVEANRANLNGHIFPLGDLLDAQATLPAKALNMLHQDQYCVGTYVAAQLLDAEGKPMDHAGVEAYEAFVEAAKDAPAGVLLPHMQALSAFWHRRFPLEYQAVQAAHSQGQLFFSMEALPKTVTCPTCGDTHPFMGLENDEYCDHMNGRTLPKILNKPNFGGGAIILPPAKPGWSSADVKTIARYDVNTIADLMIANAEESEQQLAAVKDAAPGGDQNTWEAMMTAVQMQAADAYIAEAANISPAKRRQWAEKGVAMSDGSYPVPDLEWLQKAMNAYGRSKDKKATKRHLLKRAKALHAPDEVIKRIEQYST